MDKQYRKCGDCGAFIAQAPGAGLSMGSCRIKSKTAMGWPIVDTLSDDGCCEGIGIPCITTECMAGGRNGEERA